MRELEQMFKLQCAPLVSSAGMDTFTPLVDKALLYTSPHVSQTVTALWVVQILDLCLVNSVPLLCNGILKISYFMKLSTWLGCFLLRV